MPDIFISYSRKDAPQAEQLAEMLTSAGLSCWIDKQGIDLATNWSREIVQAIDQCKAFIVLLSSSSNRSHHVTKEVSIAAEQKKKILPLVLEPVTMSEDLRYHLAGIQRAPMSNIDAILRALGKLGIEATGAPQAPKIVKEGRAKSADAKRKSLMILPFEDLSPTADSQWFADGIVSELINALSNVRSLRVMDAATTKEYKSYAGSLTTYAREMQIRYFVQGDVRKFGDTIKISARLLDIETGDHLWQDSLKGTMNDIFDIQERVAEKVVERFKIHLATHEKEKLSERGTENAEAYELSLKADEYFLTQTKDGYQLAAQLHSEAIAIDPKYRAAYTGRASALVHLYRNYDRDPALLDEALQLIYQAQEIKPGPTNPLSHILLLQGKMEEAERAAMDSCAYDPLNISSHMGLGMIYEQSGEFVKAIASFEEAVKLRPESHSALFNLVLCCSSAREEEKQKEWAEFAIPKLEKHLRLFPNDENKRVNHAVLLRFAGREEEARTEARKLTALRDGFPLYNAACLLLDLKEIELSFQTFRQSFEAGYRDVRNLKVFLQIEDEGRLIFQKMPGWEEMWQIVQQLEQESTNNPTNPIA